MSKIAKTLEILNAAKVEFAALPVQKNGRPNRIKSDNVGRKVYKALRELGVEIADASNMVETAFEVATGKKSFNRTIPSKA